MDLGFDNEIAPPATTPTTPTTPNRGPSHPNALPAAFSQTRLYGLVVCACGSRNFGKFFHVPG